MVTSEKTFVMIKPDAISRGLVGEIVGRFERAGLNIIKMNMVRLERVKAEALYQSDEAWLNMLTSKAKEAFEAVGDKLEIGDTLTYGKQIRAWLIDYVTSGPVILMVIEATKAVSVVRKLVGSTDASIAAAGTVRGDLCSDSLYVANVEKRAIKTLLHASGNLKEAKREISLMFGDPV
jgi:nucleoside-diphosphate kinase